MPAFREDLLHGTRVAVASRPGTPIRSELERLGAWTASMYDAASTGEDAAEAWVAARQPLNGLVVDAADTFGAGGETALHAALELAWVAARATATAALIPANSGRILFVAPRPDAGPHAEAARAGFENLARTLSVEWARYQLNAVVICPGRETVDTDVTELVCFLLSEAGGYFTGCRFDLGAVGEDAFIPGS